MQPFSEYEAVKYLSNLLRAISEEISTLDNEYILNESLSELEEKYLTKAKFSPIIIDDDKQYIFSTKSTSIKLGPSLVSQREITVPGTKLIIAIPYEGDRKLWSLRASQFALSGYPDIIVLDSEIRLDFIFKDGEDYSELLKKQLKENILMLKKGVEYLTKNVNEHNHIANREIPILIEKKKELALQARKIVENLGIPTKR